MRKRRLVDISGQLLWGVIGFVLTSTTSRNVGRRVPVKRWFAGWKTRKTTLPFVVVVFESGSYPKRMTKGMEELCGNTFVIPSVAFSLTYSVNVPCSDESALSILQSTQCGYTRFSQGRRHPIDFFGVNFMCLIRSGQQLLFVAWFAFRYSNG